MVFRLIAVSYEARAAGVKRGSMRGEDAQRVCPDIRLVSVPTMREKADLSKYRYGWTDGLFIWKPLRGSRQRYLCFFTNSFPTKILITRNEEIRMRKEWAHVFVLTEKLLRSGPYFYQLFLHPPQNTALPRSAFLTGSFTTKSNCALKCL